MARASKRAKRTLRRVAAAGRDAVLAMTPPAVRKRLAPAMHYLDMLLLDHLAIRLIFPNRHRLSDNAWRAAQPLPHQIEKLAQRGIRTIVNLRGTLDSSTYRLERLACARAGMELIDFRVRSRAAPSRAELLGARDLFERIEYPVLMHCKSGADRVGLMSALFLHLKQDVPVALAKKQLSLRYGHFRQADTGILDYFFERYLEETAGCPVPLFEWIETAYDPHELERSFLAKGWANRIVNGVLHRE